MAASVFWLTILIKDHPDSKLLKNARIRTIGAKYEWQLFVWALIELWCYNKREYVSYSKYDTLKIVTASY